MTTRLRMTLVATATMAACAPQVVTLNPVTLQSEPRSPSRVPEVPRPEPMEFDSPPADGVTEDTVRSDRGNLPSKTRIVSGGSNEDEALPLAEVARRERERRQNAPSSFISIDDKNIDQRTASTPEPTVRTDEPRQQPAAQPDEAAAAAPEATEVRAEPAAGAEAERYWRDRVRSLRYDWQDLVVEEERLEAKVNGLRSDYYQEDDGYYRDAEIKPEWDQAWEDLQRTREEIETTIEALERTIDEGRRAGALAGWLREGIELEPERPTEDDEGDSLRATEPVEPDAITDAAEID